MRVLTVVLTLLAFPAMATEAKPEIVRPTGTPQVVGAVHTVRTIPEACMRLEGVFTGDAQQPYRFAVVKSAPNCQPRARYLDFAKAQPTQATGWKFNDEIRVPNAACPSQVAVVRVWRRAGDATPPKLDAQGRSRIYLQEAAQQARARKMPALPAYAAEMKLEGERCAN